MEEILSSKLKIDFAAAWINQQAINQWSNDTQRKKALKSKSYLCSS